MGGSSGVFIHYGRLFMGIYSLRTPLQAYFVVVGSAVVLSPLCTALQAYYLNYGRLFRSIVSLRWALLARYLHYGRSYRRVVIITNCSSGVFAHYVRRFRRIGYISNGFPCVSSSSRIKYSSIIRQSSPPTPYHIGIETSRLSMAMGRSLV